AKRFVDRKRNRNSSSNELRRILYRRYRTEYEAVQLTENRRSHSDPATYRQNCCQRETRRGQHDAHGIREILPKLGGMFGWNANQQVEENANNQRNQAEEPIPFGNGVNEIFCRLEQFLAMCSLELFGKGSRQAAINRKRTRHCLLHLFLVAPCRAYI